MAAVRVQGGSAGLDAAVVGVTGSALLAGSAAGSVAAGTAMGAALAGALFTWLAAVLATRAGLLPRRAPRFFAFTGLAWLLSVLAYREASLALGVSRSPLAGVDGVSAPAHLLLAAGLLALALAAYQRLRLLSPRLSRLLPTPLLVLALLAGFKPVPVLLMGAGYTLGYTVVEMTLWLRLLGPGLQAAARKT